MQRLHKIRRKNGVGKNEGNRLDEELRQNRVCKNGGERHMRKLFEINSDIEKLLDKNAVIVMGENGVDSETGEVFNLAERLNALTVEKNEKIKSVVVYLDDLNGKLESIREKLDNYNKIKKSLEREITGLTDYLLFATDKQGFKDDEIEMKVKKTMRCVLTDETLIPEQFIKTKTETSISKTDITKAIKAGEIVPGTEMQANYSVQIL